MASPSSPKISDLPAILISVENQLRALRWSRDVYERLDRDESRFTEEERHWSFWNHHRMAAVDLRRLLDQDPDSSSLPTMLAVVKATPLAELPHAARQLATESLVADREILEELRQSIKRFVNKHVAHTSLRQHADRAPDFAEVDSALHTMVELFLRYRTALTGNTSRELGSEVRWS